MRILTRILSILTVFFLLTNSVSAHNGIYDIKSGETSFECNRFECNGSYIVEDQSWLLNSTDTMKFRNEYQAKWQFSKIPTSFILKDYIKLEINCRVWDSDPNEGGKPGFAYVKVVIPAPNQDRTIVKQIEVSSTVNGDIIPTIITLPKNTILKNGTLEVSIVGKGWIVLKPSSLKVVTSISSKPLKP